MAESEYKNKELLLFQLGPVQEFIAQAATVGDLWAGSYLLADLTLAAIKAVQEIGAEMVFPNLDGGVNSVVLTAMESKEDPIPTIPNRFLAIVPLDKGVDAARKAEDAVEKELQTLLACLKLTDEFKEAAEEQIKQFAQTTWAIQPIIVDNDSMGEYYKSISATLAMRRNIREFGPWREKSSPATKDAQGRNRPKDFLSGKETALTDGRGAMNLIKQYLGKSFGKDKLSVETKDDCYIAVIKLDGDKMGATLSGLATKKAHKFFSLKLAEFATSVKELIPAPGILLYAGGDDVLTVVPAKQAIEVASSLANAFKKRMESFSWRDDGGAVHAVSASAGVAIGHENTPLLDLVEAASAAESRAKNVYGRNALALSVFKRSGEILNWGCNWESSALKLHTEIIDSLMDELSARFPYKLAAYFAPYGLDKGFDPKDQKDAEHRKCMGDVMLADLQHAWERSSDEKSDVCKNARNYLICTLEQNRPQDFLNLFMCETFITRQRKEKGV